MLIKLLNRCFGDLPDGVGDALQKCTLDQLDELTNPAFDASTLDAFLAEIPESAVEEAEKSDNADEPMDAAKPDDAAD